MNTNSLPQTELDRAARRQAAILRDGYARTREQAKALDELWQDTPREDAALRMIAHGRNVVPYES